MFDFLIRKSASHHNYKNLTQKYIFQLISKLPIFSSGPTSFAYRPAHIHASVHVVHVVDQAEEISDLHKASRIISLLMIGVFWYSAWREISKIWMFMLQVTCLRTNRACAKWHKNYCRPSQQVSNCYLHSLIYCKRFEVVSILSDARKLISSLMTKRTWQKIITFQEVISGVLVEKIELSASHTAQL